uniref:glutathione gamma-glutamylcysteinyltransferase n=1 Tax=Alexandrium monilatum TaxID=311494 RepID=A0A7S4UP31_9DINO
MSRNGVPLRRLWRSFRDATRHRRLAPPSKPEHFPLPAELETLESEQGQLWAKEAVVDDRLVRSLQVQGHPAFCGIASATTITEATQVGVSDQRNFADAFGEAPCWPPVFSHYGFGCLEPLPAHAKHLLLRHLQYDGVPLSLIGEWFRVQGYGAEAVSAGDSDIAAFRSDVLTVFPSSAAELPPAARRYLMVNYSRQVVGQRMFSGGHYAPLGGYHRGLDKVLVLDVNSWRYPSVWVDLPLLWAAVHTRVGNGSWRGYLRVAGPRAAPAADN